jgi:hypothetical protein
MRIIIARSFLSSSLSFFLREARAIDVRIKRNETRTVFEPFVHFFAFKKCSHVQIIAHRPRFRDRERDKPSGCVRSRASFQSLAFLLRFLSSWGGSFLEKKRDKKQLLSLKIKTKKILTSQTQTSFLLKAQQRIQQPTTSGRRRQLLGMAHRGRERAKGPGVERELRHRNHRGRRHVQLVGEPGELLRRGVIEKREIYDRCDRGGVTGTSRGRGRG